MKISRTRNVHACLFLLPLVNAAWLCLASVIMVSQDIKAPIPSIYETKSADPRTACFTYCSLPISATIPMVSRSWATRSRSSGAAAAGTVAARRARCVGAGAGRPTHPAAPENVAAQKLPWKTSLEKLRADIKQQLCARKWRVNTVSNAAWLPVSASVCYD